MLKIWNMVADFQNVYRYSACLCSSVVLADVLQHNCYPACENELSFVGGTCVFLLIEWFGLPACFCATSRENSVDADCWFSWRSVDAVAAKQMKLSSSSPKKKQFSKSSDKISGTKGSSAVMFLVNMYPDPGHATGIRNFRSNDTVRSISFP